MSATEAPVDYKLRYAHTPGPWSVNGDGAIRPYIVAVTADPHYHGNTRRFTVAAGEQTGGQGWPALGCGGIPHEEAEGNARLIAAAPSLLSTLHNLIYAEDNGINGVRLGLLSAGTRHWFAKATGGVPTERVSAPPLTAEAARDLLRTGLNLFEPQMMRSPQFRGALDSFGLWFGFKEWMADLRRALGYPEKEVPEISETLIGMHELLAKLLSQTGLSHDSDCPSAPGSSRYDPSRCNGCAHARARAVIAGSRAVPRSPTAEASAERIAASEMQDPFRRGAHTPRPAGDDIGHGIDITEPSPRTGGAR